MCRLFRTMAGMALASSATHPFFQARPTGINGVFASDGMLYHRILTPRGQRWRTLARGYLSDIGALCSFARFRMVRWPSGYCAHRRYVAADAPVLATVHRRASYQRRVGVIREDGPDPFIAAAHWVAPGMATGDTVLVGQVAHKPHRDSQSDPVNVYADTGRIYRPTAGDVLPPKRRHSTRASNSPYPKLMWFECCFTQGVKDDETIAFVESDVVGWFMCSALSGLAAVLSRRKLPRHPRQEGYHTGWRTNRTPRVAPASPAVV